MPPKLWRRGTERKIAAGGKSSTKPNDVFARLQNFFGESREELRKVQWPTRKEAARLTLVVIIVSLILAAFLGGFDYLFAYILRLIVIG